MMGSFWFRFSRSNPVFKLKYFLAWLFDTPKALWGVSAAGFLLVVSASAALVLMMIPPDPLDMQGSVLSPISSAPASSQVSLPEGVISTPSLDTVPEPEESGLVDLVFNDLRPSQQLPYPVSLSIPRLDKYDVPIDPVGMRASGSMVVPSDVSRVGWFEPGVVPGRPGSAVIAGHVDSRSQGPGALRHLKDVVPNDFFAITYADGSTGYFVAVAQRHYDKWKLPSEHLFASSTPQPQVALITCGGRFSPFTRRYLDNTVVVATMVGFVPASSDVVEQPPREVTPQSRIGSSLN